MNKILIALLAGGSALSMSMGAAWADRPPSPQERRAIESVLREEGFIRWGQIELDDGKWEVDDARTSDGAKYDLELDPKSFRIVKRERDD